MYVLCKSVAAHRSTLSPLGGGIPSRENPKEHGKQDTTMVSLYSMTTRSYNTHTHTLIWVYRFRCVSFLVPRRFVGGEFSCKRNGTLE